MRGGRRGRRVGEGCGGIDSRGIRRGLGTRRRCRDLLRGCRRHVADRLVLFDRLGGVGLILSVFVYFGSAVREISSSLRDG